MSQDPTRAAARAWCEQTRPTSWTTEEMLAFEAGAAWGDASGYQRGLREAREAIEREEIAAPWSTEHFDANKFVTHLVDKLNGLLGRNDGR
jgi:hypothetical protein